MKISSPTEMIEQHCTCGGVYQITKAYSDSTRGKSGKSWNCPYCGEGWKSSELTEEQRIQQGCERYRQDTEFYLKKLSEQRAETAIVRRRLAATQGAVTRLKNKRQKEDVEG